MGHMTEPTVS